MTLDRFLMLLIIALVIIDLWLDLRAARPAKARRTKADIADQAIALGQSQGAQPNELKLRNAVDWFLAEAKRCGIKVTPGEAAKLVEIRLAQAKRALKGAGAAAVMVLLFPVQALAQDAAPATTGSAIGELFVKLLPELLGLVGLAMTAFVLPAARAWLLAKSKDSALARAAVELESKLTAAVAEVNARLKPSIAKASADGKITAEEAAELRREGLAIAKELLGPVGVAAVKAAFGLGSEAAFERFLGGHLEAAVERANIAASVKGEPLVAAPALTPSPASP